MSQCSCSSRWRDRFGCARPWRIELQLPSAANARCLAEYVLHACLCATHKLHVASAVDWQHCVYLCSIGFVALACNCTLFSSFSLAIDVRSLQNFVSQTLHVELFTCGMVRLLQYGWRLKIPCACHGNDNPCGGYSIVRQFLLLHLPQFC